MTLEVLLKEVIAWSDRVSLIVSLDCECRDNPTRCRVCLDLFCHTCMGKCDLCEDKACFRCLIQCESCPVIFCEFPNGICEEATRCNYCYSLICRACRDVCESCNRSACEECAKRVFKNCRFIPTKCHISQREDPVCHVCYSQKSASTSVYCK